MPLLALLLSFWVQDANRLVDDLASDDVNVRSAAERALYDLGAKAREALKAAADHKDADVRARVRAMLADARMLPIDESVRDAMRSVQTASDLEALAASIDALLKGDRVKVTAALGVAIKEGDDALRARADQLGRILAAKCETPIRYGLVLLSTEVGVGEELHGVEIFINETKAPVALLHAAGTALHEVVKLDEKEPERGGVTFTLEEPADTALSIAPGTAYTLQRPDLAADGAVRGRYTVRLRYCSVAIPKQPEGYWTGTLESNRVEFRVK